MPAWQFERFVPDDEDLDAELNAGDQWAEALKERPVIFRDGAVDPKDIAIRYAFTCGFYRGASWMRDKTIRRIQEALAEKAEE